MPEANKPITNQTTSDLHTTQVLKDPEFQQKVLEIRDAIQKNIGKSVANPNQLDKSARASVKALVEDFAIDPYWVMKCITSAEPTLHLFNKSIKRSRVQIVEDERGLLLIIRPNTQQNDIIEAWDEIEKAKRDFYQKIISTSEGGIPDVLARFKGTINKPIKNPELIYAIFRARRKNASFGTIFKQYQKGELPLYKGEKSDRFKITKDLESFYDKQKPDKEPDITFGVKEVM